MWPFVAAFIFHCHIDFDTKDMFYLYLISVYNRNSDSCTFHLNLTCRRAGFITINTRQQKASLPFKPGQGHRLQVKRGSLSVMEDLRRYITMTI